MMKNIIGFFTVLFAFSIIANAQPENASVETVGGKKYYVHIVEQGNTLYGIHRLYNASVESILAANEGLSDNLTLGQKILIPISTTNQEHYTVHTVQQGETLYGISKKYKCSVSDLKSLNDNLTDGISPGQKITVPKKSGGQVQPGEVIQTDPVNTGNNNTTDNSVDNSVSYSVSLKDSIVNHTVLPHETMYSIAKRYMVSTDTIMAVNGLRNTRIKKGDVLVIPVKRVNYEVIEKDLDKLIAKDTTSFDFRESEFKSEYSVALFLPLMLDKNEHEMTKPLKVDQVRELYSTTKISYAFYQGFLLAADSLTKAGLNINLYVYDTKKDTNEIARHFNKPEFKNMDLVVGPLYRNTIAYTTKKCASKKIRIVLPFNSDMEVIFKNPYTYKGVASNMTLLDGAVDYILENHANHNIILIKPTSSADKALFERVKERFNQGIKSVPGAYNVKIVETPLGSSSGRELNNIIKKDTTNVVIVPSTNLTFVSGAMSTMNKVMNLSPYAKQLNIVAFGLEEWNKFDELDIKYRNRLNQHYASYRYLDYNDPQSVDFIKTFRGNYGVDPNVFSTQGFDVGMYFLSALHLYGNNFDEAIAQHKMDLIQNDFQFRTVGQLSGRENQHVCIVKYNDYSLVRVK